MDRALKEHLAVPTGYESMFIGILVHRSRFTRPTPGILIPDEILKNVHKSFYK